MKARAKVLIVEGPRASGKTTLVNALWDLSWFRYKAERGENPHLDMVKFIEYASNITNRNYKIVVDRFHLTEFVMRLNDGAVPLGQLLASTYAIDRDLKALGFKTVVLDAPMRELERRIQSRADGRGREMPALKSKILWSLAIAMFKPTVYRPKTVHEIKSFALDYL